MEKILITLTKKKLLELKIVKRSEALEIIIINEGEINNWFGENAYLVRTTKFDDFINGFDGILEIDSQGTRLIKSNAPHWQLMPQ